MLDGKGGIDTAVIFAARDDVPVIVKDGTVFVPGDGSNGAFSAQITKGISSAL